MRINRHALVSEDWGHVGESEGDISDSKDDDQIPLEELLGEKAKMEHHAPPGTAV